MIKRSNWRKQWYMSVLIQSCVWEEKSSFRSKHQVGRSDSVYLHQSKEHAELPGIDGELVEFEWNIFPGFTSIEILRQIQKDLEAQQITTSQKENGTSKPIK